MNRYFRPAYMARRYLEYARFVLIGLIATTALALPMTAVGVAPSVAMGIALIGFLGLWARWAK